LLFDFGIIGSYLFMAILLYLIYTTFSRESTASEAQVLRFHNSLRYFYLLSALVISTRIVYLFSFPTELSIYKIKLNFTSLFLIWFVVQIILINIYLYYLILTGLYFRLKPQVKSNFLLNNFKYLTNFFYVDIIFVLTFYFYFSYQHFFNQVPITSHSQSASIPTPFYLYIVLLIFLLSFFIFYLKYKRKRKTLYLKIYGILFIFTLLLSIYISGIRLDYYYDIVTLQQSNFDAFSFKNGFLGWFWVTYIMLCVLSHILIYKVRKLKNDFINVQFYMNMLVHGLRFNFVCTSGLVFFTFVPEIIRFIYS